MEALPTVVYFDIPAARGDPIRLVYRITGRNFVDKRVTHAEFQEREKALAPTGQLPYIQLPNGDILTETIACLIYAAQNSSLFPVSFESTDEQSAMRMAEIFQILQLCETLYSHWGKMYHVPAEEKAAKLPEHEAESDKVLGALDKIVGKTIGGSGFAVNNQVTIADLYIFCLLGYMKGMHKVDSEPKFKNIGRCCQAVRTIPAVADYFAERNYRY